MERLTPPARAPIVWRTATVADAWQETAGARTLAFDVPDWPGHVAGQHVDVRLTAEDGYQAQRSYSIASAPEDPRLEITVERIDDGEVSPYLVDEVLPGDELELRGPIGAPFTWRRSDGGPLLLIGGGSGVVPLMSMARHLAHGAPAGIDARLLLSARSPADVIYAARLDELHARGVLAVHRTYTREPPVGWDGFARRVDAAMVEAVAPAPARAPRVYVCGPTGFVETAADALVALGHDPAAIHAERFGPTG